MKAAVQNIFSDRMKVIWYNWVAIQLLMFCYMICSWVAAADSLSKGYGFLTVWSSLLGIALLGGGTLVLRRIDYRTPLAVGFLIGVCFMMANLMLLVAVISGANMAKWGIGAAPASVNWTQAFGVMLFMAYSSFTAFVTLWRDVLLPPPMSGQDLSGGSGLPPSQSAFSGSSGNYDGGYAGNAGVEEGYADTTGGAAPM